MIAPHSRIVSVFRWPIGLSSNRLRRLSRDLALDRHCYLISVTRGHAFDEEALRAALKQPCGFIGMIGSRRRVRATLERLEAEGFDPQRLD